MFTKRNGNAHHRRRKNRNRARILDIARRLFRAKGFDQATIRDIACEANLAVGTLFNYFPSKEAVAVALAEVAIAKARQEAAKKRPGSATLEEELFLHIAAQLRALKPLRKFIQPVVDSALSAPVPRRRQWRGRAIWADQHDALADVFGGHGVDSQRWSMTVPVYWALLRRRAVLLESRQVAPTGRLARHGGSGHAHVRRVVAGRQITQFSPSRSMNYGSHRRRTPGRLAAGRTVRSAVRGIVC